MPLFARRDTARPPPGRWGSRRRRHRRRAGGRGVRRRPADTLRCGTGSVAGDLRDARAGPAAAARRRQRRSPHAGRGPRAARRTGARPDGRTGRCPAVPRPAPWRRRSTCPCGRRRCRDRRPRRPASPSASSRNGAAGPPWRPGSRRGRSPMPRRPADGWPWDGTSDRSGSGSASPTGRGATACRRQAPTRPCRSSPARRPRCCAAACACRPRCPPGLADTDRLPVDLGVTARLLPWLDLGVGRQADGDWLLRLGLHPDGVPEAFRPAPPPAPPIVVRATAGRRDSLWTDPTLPPPDPVRVEAAIAAALGETGVAVDAVRVDGTGRRGLAGAGAWRTRGARRRPRGPGLDRPFPRRRPPLPAHPGPTWPRPDPHRPVATRARGRGPALRQHGRVVARGRDRACRRDRPRRPAAHPRAHLRPRLPADGRDRRAGPRPRLTAPTWRCPPTGGRRRAW